MNNTSPVPTCEKCLIAEVYKIIALSEIEAHEVKGNINLADSCYKHLLEMHPITSELAEASFQFYDRNKQRLNFPEQYLERFESFLTTEHPLRPLLKKIYIHLYKQHLGKGTVEKYQLYLKKLGEEFPAVEAELLECKTTVKNNPEMVKFVWNQVAELMASNPRHEGLKKFASKLVSTTDISEDPDIIVPRQYKDNPTYFCQTLALQYNPECIKYISREDALGKKFLPHSFDGDINIFLVPVESDRASSSTVCPPVDTIAAAPPITDMAAHYDSLFHKGNRSTNFLIKAAIYFFESKDLKRSMFYLQQLELKNKRDILLSSHFTHKKNSTRLKKNTTSKAILEISTLLNSEILLSDENPDKNFVEGWNKLMKYIDSGLTQYRTKALLIAADFLTRHPQFIIETEEAISPKIFSEKPVKEHIHLFFEKLKAQCEGPRPKDLLLANVEASFYREKNSVYRKIAQLYLKDNMYDAPKCLAYLELLPEIDAEEIRIKLNEIQLLKALD